MWNDMKDISRLWGIALPKVIWNIKSSVKTAFLTGRPGGPFKV